MLDATEMPDATIELAKFFIRGFVAKKVTFTLEDEDEATEAFKVALAEHDREVAAQTLREAADDLEAELFEYPMPKDGPDGWLRRRARQVSADAHRCWHAIPDAEHECRCTYGDNHGAGDVIPNCAVPVRTDASTSSIHSRQEES